MDNEEAPSARKRPRVIPSSSRKRRVRTSSSRFKRTSTPKDDWSIFYAGDSDDDVIAHRQLFTPEADSEPPATDFVEEDTEDLEEEDDLDRTLPAMPTVRFQLDQSPEAVTAALYMGSGEELLREQNTAQSEQASNHDVSTTIETMTGALDYLTFCPAAQASPSPHAPVHDSKASKEKQSTDFQRLALWRQPGRSNPFSRKSPYDLQRKEMRSFKRQFESLVMAGHLEQDLTEDALDYWDRQYDSESYTDDDKVGLMDDSDKNSFLHGEDTVVYGRRGVQDPNRAKTNINKGWERIHGDNNTDPVRFANAVLSKKKDRCALPLEERRRLEKETNSFSSKPSGTAGRALLLRCWQRAVHVASSTVSDDSDPYVAPPDPRLSISNASKLIRRLGLTVPIEEVSVAETEATQATSAAAGTQLDSTDAAPPATTVTPAQSFPCPRCGIRLESKERWRSHVLGNEQYNTRGCCWQWIWNQQMERIDHVLQKRLNEIIDTVRINLMSQESQHSKVDWKSVLESLKSAVENQEEALQEQALAGVFSSDTIPVHPPLINKHVLQAVSRRLVHRYSKRPR